jgi:excisionase family DNA binding protein
MSKLEKQQAPAVLSVARAERLLGKSKDTIYRWLEEGKLSGRKVGGRWIIYQDSVEAAWEVAVGCSRE